MESEVA